MAKMAIQEIWKQVEAADSAQLREMVGAVLDVADNYALIESDQILDTLVGVLNGEIDAR